MKRFMFMMVAVLMMASLALAEANDDVAMVKQTIKQAYVEGIHINRDVEAIKKGFHEDFAMVMLRDGKISKMTIQEWIGHIEDGIKKNPNKVMPATKHKFTMVEVAGDAAVARIEIYKENKHVYTDFMSLYKFEDGWKIVNKIYYRYPDKY